MKKALFYGLLILNFIILIAFWWLISGPMLFTDNLGSTFIALGRLAGLLSANLILIQLVLIGRTILLESTFGLDRLSVAHKWNGYTVIIFLILHPILLTLGYSILTETTYLGQYKDFILNWHDVLKAALGFWLILGTVFLSITIIRKKLKYETWYYVHLFNYAALALAFGHQMNFASAAQSPAFKLYWLTLYGIAFLIIARRFLKPIWDLYRFRFTIERVEQEGPATSIYIKGRDLGQFPIQAGQYMIVRFLQQGFWAEAHPFSLSLAPNNNHLRITAKGLGDFTNKMPALLPGTKVLIDGPLGIFTALRSQNNKLLFIAGGIGITPLRSLMESLQSSKKDIVLLYANKTKQDIVFLSELQTLTVKPGNRLINILSNETVEGYASGMLDKSKIAELVEDVKERDVYLCGPPPMMKAVRKALIELGIPKSKIYYEKFALS